MGYKVIAPYITPKFRDPVTGALVIRGYLAGAVLPDEIDPDSLRHHLDSGLVVAEDDPVADIIGVPAGTPVPGEPPNVPVVETGGPARALDERVEAARKAAGLAKDKADRKPATSASKEDWRAHAVSVEQAKGRSEADAKAEVEPLTRDELVKRYG